MVVDWLRFAAKSDSSVVVVVVVMVVVLVVDWFRRTGKQTPARSESERSVRDGPENRKLLVEEPEGEKCPGLTTHHYLTLPPDQVPSSSSFSPVPCDIVHSFRRCLVHGGL
ncbi:hypothetical protein Pcinc_020165 [Petrolisthes cinctipes]|uniref:Uncharacterized protein n=1 Tax=Petrolisthes cinctipes TaxID=88211 RepID=A0AAE1FIN9_PETCI|nr:hypothetical protein Pcinc_020165 [Petrolisthes cinctipes]